VEQQVATFLPQEAAEWAQTEATEGWSPYVLDSSQSNASAALDDALIAVTAPEHLSVFNLVPELPAENQRIAVTAACREPSSVLAVRLYADGTLLAVDSEPPYEALWPLAPGQHAFHAEALLHAGDSIRSAITRITVVSNPDS
jgi:hypothetical protein